jgi:hypothetical protein
MTAGECSWLNFWFTFPDLARRQLTLQSKFSAIAQLNITATFPPFELLGEGKKG